MPNSFFLMASFALSLFLSASPFSKQTCFLRFQPISSDIDPTLTKFWCQNGGDVTYKCFFSSCHVHTAPLNVSLRFERCINQYNDSFRYVWPTAFTASWANRSVSVLSGDKVTSLDSRREEIEAYQRIKCLWGNSNNEPNLVRPDCDKCDPGW
ncbi:hypothetical protein O181_049504 [Austropuccinia psidii MF-1]|uniref:Cyanovirin-N domain-containing protein n=1 Tax=Austropuccinia psidii MF-1 TaxID=1389203 RepID=A0A9Q3DV14_9BASI|nr:hypothetical protein [Austropuccinia psidii MF-1]